MIELMGVKYSSQMISLLTLLRFLRSRQWIEENGLFVYLCNQPSVIWHLLRKLMMALWFSGNKNIHIHSIHLKISCEVFKYNGSFLGYFITSKLKQQSKISSDLSKLHQNNKCIVIVALLKGERRNILKGSVR